jgi:two-component system, OmpR family, response regulator ChvI
MSIPTEEICFIRSEYYCVSFIKIVPLIENIKNSDAAKKYYSIIFNMVVAIARSFDAKIVKNLGDGLVCYFPKTNISTDDAAFKDVIECGLTVMAARHIIEARLFEEKLPTVNFRISVDYGKVEVAKSITSAGDDLFGSPMNLCSKINSKAAVNEMVMGDNLYQNIKKRSSSSSLYFDLTKNYSFKQVAEYSWAGGNKGNRHRDDTDINNNKEYQNNPYKIFSVEQGDNSRKNKNDVLDLQREKEHSKNCNIMIVDDERDLLITYKAILEKSGYNVNIFTNPYEALLYFAKGDPAYYKLVILDIRMPNVNGLQLYYRLKAISNDIKIVFLSALDAAKELVSMIPCTNGNVIINKPVEKEYLVNRVKAELLV